MKKLNLSGTQINALPECIGSLSNLQILDASWMQISTLPESIGNLSNLQSLDLSNSKISALPESIGNLICLQSINLCGTKICVLPGSFGNLTNLHTLDLSASKIHILPGCICNLTNLQVLMLSCTQINNLPDSIGCLTNLQEINLFGSKINTLPNSIGNLTNLRAINLFDSQISTLPNSIGNLINLQELDLSWTKISVLPDSIGNLTNLRKIDLFNSKISALPDSIGNLSNLKRLDLRGLRLQQLPRSLFNLGLNFSFNEFSWDGINLDCTTLSTQPISLFHQPRELIQAYYDAPKDTINDAKVIFLGDGGVGKSRTIKRLLNGGELGDYPTELTPGIDISSYRTTCNGHPVDLCIWDFGGQEIMHAMHRCFLTDRTCYVVMVSNRFGNRTQRARYWLKTIDSFAKNCPVILAVNLWDTDEGIDGVNGKLLEAEFDNLKKIITYSAKGSDKDHFNRLTEAIVEQASRLDSCGMEFPQSWAQYPHCSAGKTGEGNAVYQQGGLPQIVRGKWRNRPANLRLAAGVVQRPGGLF